MVVSGKRAGLPNQAGGNSDTLRRIKENVLGTDI